MDTTHEANVKKFFEENPEFEKVELPTKYFSASFTLSREEVFVAEKLMNGIINGGNK
ncbi:MAG: hypothetical protein WC967_09195 [Balneolaceae bacterium]